MSPARLCAGLCTQAVVNPLLDERVSAVREEPELHLKIHLRNVSTERGHP